MRADRLLSLILLLQAAPAGRSAPELAARLDVSVRTVLRDVDALSSAGIPVYTERGRSGGIRLLDSYRRGVVGLTREEGASLAVGQSRLAGDLGLGDALDTALEKITGRRGGFAQGKEHILVDVDPWMRSGEAVPALPAVHDGLIRRRRLDLDYRDSETRERRVTVHPLGLVAKAGVWYLVARPDDAADPALFRVSRVRACATRPEPAERPDGFDLETAWQGLRRRVEARPRELRVTVRLDPATAPMVRRMLTPHTRLAGAETLELAFGGVEHAVGMLLGLGTKVNVVTPDAVREAMRTAASDVAAMYA